MTAFSIAHVEIRDGDAMARYSEIAGRVIVAHGGRFLFAGVPEVAEGQWPSGRVIAVFEFPSMAELRSWYDSPEYAEARRIGETAFQRELLFVDASA